MKGIIGIRGIAKDAVADTQHHRPVPFDKQSERRFVALGQKSTQKLAVAFGVLGE
ncbi:MAG TPA: hypothetical protein VE988_03925 [Gemmataceae bacterium]|nr:hypothetical protein [Gemmataceae bacterium]